MGLGPARQRCQRHQQLLADDSDVERLRREINQRASAARTLRGENGPGCFVPGLHSSNTDEYKVIRAVEARSGEEAAVAELDMKLEDWASAGLTSVAADFYHALILFCKRKALKVGCLDHQRG